MRTFRNINLCFAAYLVHLNGVMQPRDIMLVVTPHATSESGNYE